MGWDVCPDATRITQDFGCTDFNGEWAAPWCADGFFHAGIDVAADDIAGKPVYATRAGVVVANADPPHWITRCPAVGGGTVFAPYLGPNAVIVQHVEDDGTTVWIEHGHLSHAAVAVGQQVQVGDLLGLVGTLGSSCGDHLHLEVRADGPTQGVANNAAAVRDPTQYLGVFTMATAQDVLNAVAALSTQVANLSAQLAQTQTNLSEWNHGEHQATTATLSAEIANLKPAMDPAALQATLQPIQDGVARIETALKASGTSLQEA